MRNKDEATRARVRANMKRLGIPVGTGLRSTPPAPRISLLPMLDEDGYCEECKRRPDGETGRCLC